MASKRDFELDLGFDMCCEVESTAVTLVVWLVVVGVKVAVVVAVEDMAKEADKARYRYRRGITITQETSGRGRKQAKN